MTGHRDTTLTWFMYISNDRSAGNDSHLVYVHFEWQVTWIRFSIGLCTFRMTGHLDTILNWFMLDPR